MAARRTSHTIETIGSRQHTAQSWISTPLALNGIELETRDFNKACLSLL
ncbi:hypothetical protein EKH55_3916 [Sinorhizobium alkalisoli]|nr:hypothetical protein EKH55_3916 [Sinorhizobium alkalisoli]